MNQQQASAATTATGTGLLLSDGAGGCAITKTAIEIKKKIEKKVAKFIPLVNKVSREEEDDLHWIPNHQQSYSSLTILQHSPLPAIHELFEDEQHYHAFVVPDIYVPQLLQLPPRQDGNNKGGNFKKCLMDLVSGKHFTFITTKQREEIRNSIKQDYNEILLEQHALLGDNNKLLQVDAIHHAATHVIQEFLASRPILHATTYMGGTNQDVVYEVLEDFVYPQIVGSYSPINNTLTPANAAKAVTWIDHFVETMKSTTSSCPGDDDDVHIRDAWLQDRDDLVMHYIIKGVQREMNACLRRATDLQSEDDVRQQHGSGVGGYLVTGFPGQIAYLYHQQLSVAQSALPSIYHEVVLAACNLEMVEIVADVQRKLTSNWKSVNSAYFCALINDASLLAEQCEERNELFLQSDEFRIAGDALVRSLVEFSLHATRLLCQHFMFDVDKSEPILQSVGSAAWEAGNTANQHAVTERMIETFKDYFEDLDTWIMSSDYYFPKILKICFDATLDTYMKSFFSNTMANGVKDAAVVADELRDDYVRLAAFFNGPCCDKYHDRSGGGGFYTQHVINERLRILQSLATLVDPNTRPKDEMDDIKAVLSEFQSGGQASAIVLHLAGLHECRKRQKSTDWVKAIAVAKKELDANSSSGENDNKNNKTNESDAIGIGMLPSSLRSPSGSYNVPDLTQSRYVYNFRPTRLETKVSAGTLPYAASTLELLKTPGLTNRVRFGVQSVTPQLANKVHQLGIQAVSPGLMDRIQLAIHNVCAPNEGYFY
jgi:Exocyst complex component Sec6